MTVNVIKELFGEMRKSDPLFSATAQIKIMLKDDITVQNI